MVSKSVWGPCVWFLFHTLAYKAVPENFAEIKTELIQYIQRICANLPCPECTQHATEYMKQHSRALSMITTKDQLHQFLVDFHNVVNVRKQKPRFTYEQADAKYKLAKTGDVVQYFFKIYGERTNGGNLKLFVNGFQKQLLLSDFSAWIVRNYGKFYG
jgi:Erv1 / Alr family